MIRIRPGSRGRGGPTLAELWAHRELLASFCSREFQVRHQQTLLGPAWIVLQPALQALVFALFMHRVAGVPAGQVPYPAFAWAGLLPWMFFSNGVQALAYALMANGHLVSRVYFPRLLLPLSLVLVRLVDFAAATAVFLLLCPLLGVTPSWKALGLPILMAQAALLTFAAGAWSSTTLLRFRDFGTLLPVGLQFAMFASPVIYPTSLVPGAWQELYLLNPMAAIIEAFRACAVGGPFPLAAWGLSLVVTFALAVAFLSAFARAEEAALEAL
ncbi:MAG: ABC transporter permease [Vicinamibacteria bacterium]|nr:ABC transporter permease [Vicinamibacteria bacterium]